MNVDFSLSNIDISRFFSGDDSNPPVRELVYVHTHPFIQPNFVNQIGDMVNEYSTILTRAGVGPTSSAVVEVTDLCISLGQSINDLTIKDPTITLNVLRDIYKVCLKGKGIV